jgi:integrase
VTLIPRGNKIGVKVWDRGLGKYRWVGTYTTEDEALLAEQAAEAIKLGVVPTVEAWANAWLSDNPREAESTQRTYKYAVRDIIKRLGKLRLDQVSRPEARKIATHEWARNTARVARTMWADAVRDGICEVNPWTNLRLETPRGRKDIDALNEAEIDRLAEIALCVHGDYGPEARAIILTLGHTALRPAEVCALRPEDIGLLDEEVTAAGSRIGSRGVKKPKNGLGRRIVLPAKAIAAIREMPRMLDDKYLFHGKRGGPLNKGTLHYMWKEVRSAWLAEGGRYITPYALRHASATALIEKGVAVGDVAFQLGHQDGGRLVMELYGHPGEDAIRERLKLAQGIDPSPQRSQRVRRKASA